MQLQAKTAMKEEVVSDKNKKICMIFIYIMFEK